MFMLNISSYCVPASDATEAGKKKIIEWPIIFPDLLAQIPSV